MCNIETAKSAYSVHCQYLPQDARAQMKRKMSTFLLSGVLITYNYKTELFSLTLS